MKAKQYLQQIGKMDRLIKNKLIEKEQWQAMATSTAVQSSGDRVQSSGSQQKMADAVYRMVELEEEINAYIDRFVDIKKEVIMTIESLPTIEYDILHQIYIQYRDLGDVANSYNRTISWVSKRRNQGIRSVQKLLDERGKDGKDC